MCYTTALLIGIFYLPDHPAEADDVAEGIFDVKKDAYVDKKGIYYYTINKLTREGYGWVPEWE